ncbi:DUF4123 domain-containing protein [Pseudomonas taetrolens]|uniref:DUF4123 domain-containing protein n=1 Tax=Pseudomonas taetrolens TaxID=47884 RepID=UPI003F99F487
MSPVSPWQWIEEQHRQGRELCLILDSLGEMETRQTLLNGRACDRYASVYDQTSVARLANAGPYLILLSRADTEALSGLLGAPERNWGWLASIAQGDLPALLEHWRQRFLLGSRPNQALYRFHDNRTLTRALDHLSPDAFPPYLGPTISLCYWQGEHWLALDNPEPGEYPLPAMPEWLQVPTPGRLRGQVHVINVYRYLLAHHYEALRQLARHRRPLAWIHAQRMQAEQWGWLEQEHLQFLALHSLPRPGNGVPDAWNPRPDETPHMHFERVSQMAGFSQGEGVL